MKKKDFIKEMDYLSERLGKSRVAIMEARKQYGRAQNSLVITSARELEAAVDEAMPKLIGAYYNTTDEQKLLSAMAYADKLRPRVVEAERILAFDLTKI